MFSGSRLPPLYRLVPLGPGGDPAAEARCRAEAGADPGTVVCAQRDDRLDCAVILHPDRPRAECALVVYVATLGLGDALGSVMPAGIDVTYGWPNRIDANLGAVARLAVALPDGDPNAVPDWLVLHALAVLGPLEGEGVHVGFPETSLRDEGCAEATTAALLESFARHFLTWVNRWRDDGFDPVRAMWLRHSLDHGKDIRFKLAGETVSGTFEGIDDDGAMIIEANGTTRRVALEAALHGPQG